MREWEGSVELRGEIDIHGRGRSVSPPRHSSEPTSLADTRIPNSGACEATSFDPDEIARTALAARHAERRCYRSVKLWLCRRCGTQSPVNASDLCMPCQEEAWWAEDNRRVCNWIHRRVEMTDS